MAGLWSQGFKDKALAVKRLFASIARRYDLLNNLLSLGQDKRWRQGSVRLVQLKEGQRVIDVCTGTAELALAIASWAPQSKVVGVDFCPEMLMIAKKKVERLGLNHGRLDLLQADAQNLPFPNEVFEAAFCAFGIRNLADLPRGLKELQRVVVRGGRVVVLEFDMPRSLFFSSFYKVYFTRVLPLVGRFVSGDREAYSYLASSVVSFSKDGALKEAMEQSGLRNIEVHSFSLGIARAYIGRKAS